MTKKPVKTTDKRGASHRGQGRVAAAPRHTTRFTDKSDRNTYVHLIGLLKKKALLPTIVFSFSKRKCDDYANALTNVDLTSGAAEKSDIHVFCEKSLQRLSGSSCLCVTMVVLCDSSLVLAGDRELPQVLRMRELLSRGIAVHHAGLLPIIKEVLLSFFTACITHSMNQSNQMVEILFTRGLVKILFATETFAMGVNAPAKAVVFARLQKHDGRSMRDLLPGSFLGLCHRMTSFIVSR